MQGHNSSFGKGSESSSGGSGGMNNNQQSSLVPPPPERRWSSYASSGEACVNAGKGEAQGAGEASGSSSSRNHVVGSMAKEMLFPPRAMVNIRNASGASSSHTHHHHHHHQHQAMDLNEGYSGNIGDAEPNLYLSSSRLEREPEYGTAVPPDIDESLEGSDGNSGPHCNWGLSCKRKSFEGTSSHGGASSSSGSGSGSGSFLQPENYVWNNSYGRVNASNTFRLFGSEPQDPRAGISDPFPSLNVNPGTSLRQIGAEPSSLSQHDSIPFNMASAENARHLSLRHPPPFRNSFELRPPQSSGSGPISTQNPSERLYSPSFFGTNHLSPWHSASSSSRTGVPNSFPFIDREETSLRGAPRNNNTDHPIFAHDSLARGGIDIPSSTRVPSSSSNHLAANHPWIQPHGSSSENRQRAMELAPWSLFPTLDSQPHAGRDPLPAGPSLSRDSPIPPARNNNQNRQQPYLRSTFLADRHVEDALSVSNSLRALNADAEGRRRLISEIRHVLHAMRRGENLQIEDYMVFDPFLSHGMAELQDRHRDMRLDVDNMSYEELLALGERIGEVNTGLSEEAISRLLKRRRHWSLVAAAQSGPDPEPCCVCQEEYVEGDDIGVLDCGHDFHTECVKQWLKHKNLCPICKTTGLLT